jgi:sugar lactone lactonase YvrE
VRFRRWARWSLVPVAAAALVAGSMIPATGAPLSRTDAGRAAAGMRAARAQTSGGGNHGGVTVVADRLNNPRGLDIAGGALYVAEAGRGGPTCLPPPDEVCIGFTSTITKVDHRGQRRVVRGLLSIAGPDGTFATGADDVSVARRGHGLFTIITGGPCELPPGVPPEAVRQVGKLLRAKGGRKPVVADITAFECANNPDRSVVESNPYSVYAISNRHQVVADAAGNSILDVRNGRVSLLAVIPDSPNGTDQVPTSVTRGPDGAFYVGTLAEGAGNGGANVWRIVPGHAPEVFVSGLTAVVDVAFGPDGSLYACEFSTDLATFSPAGAIVRVRPNGRRTVLGEGSLFFPGGVAVSKRGKVYVSNWSVLTARGGPAPFPPDARGQVVRLHT